MPETLSAIRAMGAFELEASCTSFIIFPSVASSPTFTALTVKNPLRLVVPEIMLSPTALYTGILSPVTDASFTDDSPETISPSQGKFSPARITNKSPTLSSEIGISFSSPSTKMRTTFGARAISPLIADVVLPLLYASSIFPRVISTRIIAADSKYNLCGKCIACDGFTAESIISATL